MCVCVFGEGGEWAGYRGVWIANLFPHHGATKHSDSIPIAIRGLMDGELGGDKGLAAGGVLA